jgi:putative glycosyltransferase (TIGR04372 family)
VYLSTRCKFFLGNSAGLLYVPISFGTPVAQANMIPIDCRRPAGASDVWLPKLLKDKSGRLLTFREIAELGPGWVESAKYEKAGLTPVENTAEEILGLALEMDDRLDGKWKVVPGDEELQAKFWSFFPEKAVGCRYRVAASFLRARKELLA